MQEDRPVWAARGTRWPQGRHLLLEPTLSSERSCPVQGSPGLCAPPRHLGVRTQWAGGLPSPQNPEKESLQLTPPAVFAITARLAARPGVSSSCPAEPTPIPWALRRDSPMFGGRWSEEVPSGRTRPGSWPVLKGMGHTSAGGAPRTPGSVHVLGAQDTHRPACGAGAQPAVSRSSSRQEPGRSFSLLTGVIKTGRIISPSSDRVHAGDRRTGDWGSRFLGLIAAPRCAHER